MSYSNIVRLKGLMKWISQGILIICLDAMDDQDNQSSARGLTTITPLNSAFRFVLSSSFASRDL